MRSIASSRQVALVRTERSHPSPDGPLLASHQLTLRAPDESAAWTHDAFGEVCTQSGTLSTDFLFTDEQRDGESAFYYLRTRCYHPDAGRFLGQDPIRRANPYAYAASLPSLGRPTRGLSHDELESRNWTVDFGVWQ